MPANDDWIRRMLDRGVLEPDDDKTPKVATPATSPDAPLLFSCAACSTVFPAPGLDPNAPPACPACGGPTKRVALGERLGNAAEAKTRRSFGRYELRRELGRGGMGVVHEAWDAQLGRAVALKMLTQQARELDGEAVERLQREARSAGKLRHPGIVAVLDVGRAEGRHYFTMELVEGPTLEALLSGPAKAFPLPRRLAALLEVAEALAFAHENGIVHRDLKPANVLFDRDGRAKLTDFGLAKEEAAGDATALTLTGVVLGTPSYMSPEQAAGGGRAVGPASDVFSFGIVLYRAVTGKLPFTGDALETLHRIAREDPPPPKRKGGLPKGLAAVCMTCLEKDPAKRYPDAGALAEDLRRVLRGESVKARLPKKKHRSRLSALDERSRAEALRLLELGRPALDRAFQSLYDAGGDDAELERRLVAAQKNFEDAVAKSRSLPLAHYLLGLALELRGDFLAAESEFREALRLDPEFGPAHYWLGRMLLLRAYVVKMRPEAVKEGAGDLTDEALACFEAAVARGSGFEDDLQLKLAGALALLLRGDAAAARAACREGLAAFASSRGREDLHWVLAIASDSDEAVREIDRAFQVRPRFPLALYSRTRFLREKGDTAGLVEDLKRVAAWWPRFYPAWVSIASALLRLGRPQEALVASGRAVEISPFSAMAWTNRASVKAQLGDFEGALADSDRAIELAPGLAAGWNGRGRAMAHLGRRDEELAAHREAVKLSPADPDFRADLGRALTSRGDFAAAEEIFSGILRESPKLAQVWNARSANRVGRGDFAGALSDAREAERLEPANWRAWCNSAVALLATGDFAGAEKDATEALRLHPPYALALWRRGQARLKLGKPREALEDVLEAQRLGLKEPDMWTDAGDARAALGDAAGAKSDWQKAASLAPAGSPERADAEARLRSGG